MGYNTSANTLTITAKLTPIGRKKLILSNNNLVTSFAIGDSDANYNTSAPLLSGNIPSNGGNIGAYTSTTNSVWTNTSIKSFLLVNNTGATAKLVDQQSNNVTTTILSNGFTTATTATITQDLINRSNTTDALVNLFYSLNLPLNSAGDFKFTGATSGQGGYSNTAFSGLAQTNILVLGIDNSLYGEIIDGKSIKITLSAGTTGYTIYSSFQNNGQSLSVLDGNYSDPAINVKFFGDNTALLFSDEIQKPNNNVSLSWGSGWKSIKPFSVNRKQPYNLTTNTNINQYVDKPVGIAYLDKGLIVITHPDIVDNFNTSSTATTITFESLSTSVQQNITCIANRGEFGTSTNSTFTYSDTPRISEIGLYDIDNDLIAIAKTDRHIVKGINEFLAIGIKISV